MRSTKLLLSILGFVLLCTAALADGEKKFGEVRRVVTTVDPNGKAVVMFDDRIPLMAARAPVGVGELMGHRKFSGRIVAD